MSSSASWSISLTNETERRLDTFLPLERSALPFQTIDLGGRSTDMLLSLLTSESADSYPELSRALLADELCCTRWILDSVRWFLENLTLFTLVPSLSADFSCVACGLLPIPCSVMKWALRSSAVSNVFPQFFSKHLVDVHHLVPCLVLLQFLQGSCRAVDDVPLLAVCDCCWYRMLLFAEVFAANTCCARC